MRFWYRLIVLGVEFMALNSGRTASSAFRNSSESRITGLRWTRRAAPKRTAMPKTRVLGPHHTHRRSDGISLVGETDFSCTVAKAIAAGSSEPVGLEVGDLAADDGAGAAG